MFLGFVPPKPLQRQKFFREFANISISLIFYESSERLESTLKEMKKIFGNRPAAVLRELTKLHEEVRRGSLNELYKFYSENTKPRGEIIIVVGPAENIEFITDKEIIDILKVRLKTLSLRDAVLEVAEITQQPRNKIYNFAIGLKQD